MQARTDVRGRGRGARRRTGLQILAVGAAAVLAASCGRGGDDRAAPTPDTLRVQSIESLIGGSATTTSTPDQAALDAAAASAAATGTPPPGGRQVQVRAGQVVSTTSQGGRSTATVTLPALPSRPTFDDPLVEQAADCMAGGPGAALGQALARPGVTRTNEWIGEFEASGVGSCLRDYLTALVRVDLAPKVAAGAPSASLRLLTFESDLDGVELLRGDVMVTYDGVDVRVTFLTSSGVEQLRAFTGFERFQPPFPTDVLRSLFDRADQLAEAMKPPTTTTTGPPAEPSTTTSTSVPDASTSTSGPTTSGPTTSTTVAVEPTTTTIRVTTTTAL